MSTAAVLGAITFAVVAIIGTRTLTWAAAPRRPATAVSAIWRFRPPLLVRRSRRGPDEVATAAWCERVAAGVRAGSSLTRAVIDADGATVVAERPFPTAAHGLARGRSLAEALGPNHDGPTTAVGLVAPVLIAAADLGGSPAEPIERVAATLLARATERQERRASSAQAQLSARVLTMLPFGVLALLALAEPSIRHVLVTPAGLTCLTAGTALNLLGWWWSLRLIGGTR